MLIKSNHHSGFTPSLTSRKKSVRGFTLLEILLVIGIIAILAGIVIVAINPGRQLATVRNTQRQMNLGEINKALQQYYIDNRSYPSSVTTTLTEICDTDTASSTHSLDCTNLVDLSPLVPTYLVAIPTDPQATSTTGYEVRKDSTNKIILQASNAELNNFIGIGGGIPMSGLVSYWSFDGNALDSVGDNDGTLYGDTALTTGVKGLANTAYAFDGTEDYISIVQNDTLEVQTSNNGMTISAWINIGGSGGGENRQPIIFHPRSGSATGYGLACSEGVTNKAWFSLYDGTVNPTLEGTTLFTNGLWYHVAGVYNKTNLIIYVNAINENQTSDLGFSEIDRNTPVYIGTWVNSVSRGYFNGSIDNVRIYNRALTADEVANIYNMEKP